MHRSRFSEAVGGDDDGEHFWIGVVVGFAVGFVFAGVLFGLAAWWAVRIVTEGPST